MNDILMIMNPRYLEEVVNSIGKLNIPKVWFRGYLERELEVVMNDFVKQTKYDNYILMSDDLVINMKSFNKIRNSANEYDILTGYCNLYMKSELVNICLKPLTLSNKRFPTENDYSFCTIGEVKKQPKFFQTYIAGFAVTSIKRDIWLEFPFQTYHTNKKGESSDHNFSYRIQQSGRKIYAHNQANFLHIKTKRNNPLKKTWLVGSEPARVILEG